MMLYSSKQTEHNFMICMNSWYTTKETSVGLTHSLNTSKSKCIHIILCVCKRIDLYVHRSD